MLGEGAGWVDARRAGPSGPSPGGVFRGEDLRSLAKKASDFCMCLDWVSVNIGVIYYHCDAGIVYP